MSQKLFKIVLDPGHGGKDPGAVVGATEEDDINFIVTEYLGAKLQAKGFVVLFTRKKDDYVSPSNRLRIIREAHPDVFVSIHCNTADSSKVHGSEIYYRDEFDLPLARAIEKSLAKSIVGCRGVFQDVARLGRRLAVLGDLKTPAVLIELGYLTNDDERETIIKNPDAIAELIASSVTAFIEETND